jgi:hypothetical protein
MRLFRLILISLATLSLLSSVVIAAGHAQPLPPLLPGLGICDGTPCYFGIVPQKTKMADAIATIKNIPGAVYNEEFDTASKLPEVEWLYIIAGQPAVLELGINPANSDHVVAADVIANLGNPCCIAKVRDIRGDLLVLKYPRLGIFFPLEKQGNSWVIRPFTPVKQIMLCPPSQIDICMPWFGKNHFSFWRGFGKYPILDN